MLPTSSELNANELLLNEPEYPAVVTLSTLHCDPDNARIHDAENIEYLRGLYRRFGQRKPVVAWTESSAGC
jgi:hypothetical protein